MNNKIRNAFDSVRAEEALKKSTKEYLAAKTRAAAARRPHGGRALAAAFACLALIVLGFGGYRIWVTPVSAISLDINPSIELSVNRFDRVVSVTGYNEDGRSLADAVDINNMEYADALDALLSCEAAEPYLKNDALVSITVIGSTDKKSEEMLSHISSRGFGKNSDIEYSCGIRGDVEAAHEVGLSFGKYQVFLELQALAPELSADDVKGLTMRQLRNMITELALTADGSQSGSGYGDGSESAGGDGGNGSGDSGSGSGSGNNSRSDSGSGSGNGAGSGTSMVTAAPDKTAPDIADRASFRTPGLLSF